MSTTLAQTRPVTLSTISPEFAVKCLFLLLGLTLFAAVLSYVWSGLLFRADAIASSANGGISISQGVDEATSMPLALTHLHNDICEDMVEKAKCVVRQMSGSVDAADSKGI